MAPIDYVLYWPKIGEAVLGLIFLFPLCIFGYLYLVIKSIIIKCKIITLWIVIILYPLLIFYFFKCNSDHYFVFICIFLFICSILIWIEKYIRKIEGKLLSLFFLIPVLLPLALYFVWCCLMALVYCSV